MTQQRGQKKTIECWDHFYTGTLSDPKQLNGIDTNLHHQPPHHHEWILQPSESLMEALYEKLPPPPLDAATANDITTTKILEIGCGTSTMARSFWLYCRRQKGRYDVSMCATDVSDVCIQQNRQRDCPIMGNSSSDARKEGRLVHCTMNVTEPHDNTSHNDSDNSGILLKPKSFDMILDKGCLDTFSFHSRQRRPEKDSIVQRALDKICHFLKTHILVYNNDLQQQQQLLTKASMTKMKCWKSSSLRHGSHQSPSSSFPLLRPVLLLRHQRTATILLTLIGVIGGSVPLSFANPYVPTCMAMHSPLSILATTTTAGGIFQYQQKKGVVKVKSTSPKTIAFDHNKAPTKIRFSENNAMWILRAMGYSELSKPGWIMLALAATLSYRFWEEIPKQDVGFAVLWPLYIGLINRIRFQRNQLARNNSGKQQVKVSVPLLFQDKGPWFLVYIQFFGIMALMLPLVVCFMAPMTTAVIPAATHTLLILAQVWNEHLSRGPYMHPLPKLLIPIGFNTYRMSSLCHWVKESYKMVVQQQSTSSSSSSSSSLEQQLWAVVGFLLGLGNLMAWTYNLLIFLLLRVTPQYWDTNTFPTCPVQQWKWQLFPCTTNNRASPKSTNQK